MFSFHRSMLCENNENGKRAQPTVTYTDTVIYTQTHKPRGAMGKRKSICSLSWFCERASHFYCLEIILSINGSIVAESHLAALSFCLAISLILPPCGDAMCMCVYVDIEFRYFSIVGISCFFPSLFGMFSADDSPSTHYGMKLIKLI